MKNRWCSIIIFLALIMIISITGCNTTTNDKEEVKKTEEKSQEFPVTVKDDADSEVTVDIKPKKIISLTPASTEVIYALEADDRLVGVTTFCDYPEEAKEKEKIGDFQNPNVELIIALEPDLVIATTGVQDNLVSKLKEIEASVYIMDPKSLAGIVEDIEEIGQLIGSTTQSEKLTSSMEEKIEKVKSESKDQTKKPRLFLELSADPIYTAGGNTFQHDLIETAGAENIGAEAGQGFALMEKEALLKADPEMYIAGKGTMSEPEALYKRPGFEGISAVKNKKVFIFDDNLIMRPGPRIVLGLEKLAMEIKSK